MTLPHTKKPNATLYFETKPEEPIASRNIRTSAIAIGDTETDATFSAGIYIRPLDFRDSQARAILPAGVDFSSSNTWAGGWRLTRGVTVPTWIVDGKDCSLKFVDGKPMTAIFYKVPGRSDFAKGLAIGPEFVVLTKRFN
jgi:hypothetical protein